MTKPIIKIVDANTGQEIEREMNAQELTQWQKDQADIKAFEKDKAAKATAKADLLARLGITEEEAALLLG